MNTKILCFEPNPINIPSLKKVIPENGVLYEYCLSDVPSISGFYNWKDQSKNLIGNQIAGLRSGGSKICDVTVTTINDVLDQAYGLDNNLIIKFIKIDTEGNDTNVIKGMNKYLPKTKYIIFECSNCLDDFRGPGIKNPMKDIIDFLSRYGFDTYRIGTKKLIKVNDEYWDEAYEKVKYWSN